MDFELVKNKKLENKFKIPISANEIEEEVIKKVNLLYIKNIAFCILDS